MAPNKMKNIALAFILFVTLTITIVIRYQKVIYDINFTFNDTSVTFEVLEKHWYSTEIFVVWTILGSGIMAYCSVRILEDAAQSIYALLKPKEKNESSLEEKLIVEI